MSVPFVADHSEEERGRRTPLIWKAETQNQKTNIISVIAKLRGTSFTILIFTSEFCFQHFNNIRTLQTPTRTKHNMKYECIFSTKRDFFPQKRKKK